MHWASGAGPSCNLHALDQAARKALGAKEAEARFVRQYRSTRADLQHFRTASYLQDLAETMRPTPVLASITVPALVLLSRGSTFAAPDASAAVIAQLPQHQIVRIDCNHWPLTEKPAEVRQTIERWCAALPARAIGSSA
jgi:pimeloyl-ACP methyl ester carboxylesterase